MNHEHSASHLPPSGTGVAVCECGATQRVEAGKPAEPWHACPLCVAAFEGTMKRQISLLLDEWDQRRARAAFELTTDQK